MAIGLWHVLGIGITLALIIGIGIYSGSKVKNAADFATGGGKAGMWLVGGAIMGSLVSGQATVGTAQLAFTYGLSAWWFTLGSGIGCLLLAIAYVIPLRHSGNMTLLQIIGAEYGPKAEYLGSVLCSIGIFISVTAQILAASALLTTIFAIPVWMAAGISVMLMACYVMFGGAWGAGLGGVAKLVLLYLSCIFGCILVLVATGGWSSFMDFLQQTLIGTSLGNSLGIATVSDFHGRYFHLLARGASKDIGSGLSLILGILATQTYAQAIWSGKSDSAARKGSLLSAFLIPPIGIACIFIGLFMRGHYITSAEIAMLNQAGQMVPAGMMEIASTAQVFPMFIVQYMPKLLGGMVLGTLLITIVGGGAGLSLGVATILVNDILQKVFVQFQEAKANLHATRMAILWVLAAGALLASFVPGAIINDFGFLSMGLRAAVVFIPLNCALFLSDKIDSKWILLAILSGPIAVLCGELLKLPFDSLFLGMLAALLCALCGYFSLREGQKGVDKG